MATSQKLNYLNTTKNEIKNAIMSKGVNVLTTDTFRSYASKIRLIPAMVVTGADATNEIDLICVGGYGSLSQQSCENLITGNYIFRRIN